MEAPPDIEPPQNPEHKDRSGFWDQPVIRARLPGKLQVRIVRSLRVALPLVAAGVIGLLMVWPRVQQTMAPIEKEAATAGQRAVGKNELMNPVFRSLDSQNQPFTVGAAHAAQSINDTDTILLDKPTAGILLNSGHRVAAKAMHGTYGQEAGKLSLEGDVTLTEDEGYIFTTSKALLNMKTHQAFSDQPVQGHGPAGSIQASGIQIYGDNQVMVFTGPARLILTQTKGK
jgi:lipopolysaccharide export system protein LptC